MFEWIDFTKEPGEHNDKKIQVLALRTCAVCKEGMEFLASYGFSYQYTFANELSTKDKKRLKEEFQDHFGEHPFFPTIIVNDTDYRVGLVKDAWKEVLGIPSE
ncbi:MAG: glutaredoxin [Alkalispirochaeta sp.]